MDRIPEGYHPRMDGAMNETSDRSHPLTCDVCGHLCRGRVGFEYDYPNHPDLFVCGSCAEDWELRRQEETHEATRTLQLD